MESVTEFLRHEAEFGYGNGYGYDDGDGSGRGNGSGRGDDYGNGYGSGRGDDYGNGYGSGRGNGYGSGRGYGYGFGNGSGFGFGSGNGSGNGYGNKCIKSFCGNAVHEIDGVPTIIRKVSHGVAKGFILHNDFTLIPCFVVKRGNLFAHGKTLHEARDALLSKLFDDMNEDERIAEFVKCHKKGVEYPNRDFFEWHHRLTGSCLAGREAFIKNHEIDMDGKQTVMEFIQLTENDYGGRIIKRLRGFY